MSTCPDFEELLRLLEENRVDYMIVGGYAVAFHGYPRFTKDIDTYFDATSENVARLRTSLTEFGFAPHDLPEAAFLEPGTVLTFGNEPSRVDLLNTIDGLDFPTAKTNTVRGRYGANSSSTNGRRAAIRMMLTRTDCIG